MNYQEMQVVLAKWRKAKDIADRITAMRIERARKACAEAGLDPGLLGIHPHNAMLDFNRGKPWPNVDYSKVRLCLWLSRTAFEASRVLDRYYQRLITQFNE